MTMSESTIRWEQDADNIVTLILDDPQQSANTMNERYMRSMEETVTRLEKEKDDIAGVIITSAKSTFFAGGDLRDLAKVTKENAPQFAKGVEAGKAQLRRLETLGKPVVAALNGTALGGGLEIALACHHRVALDNPKAQFGFPEVTLGLLPGAGGVVRSVRMLGIQDALMQVLMQGQRLKVAKAKSLGIIDEVADSEDDMLAKAREWIKANPKAKQPWDEKGFKIPGGTPAPRRSPRTCRRSRPTCASSSRAPTTRRRATSWPPPWKAPRWASTTPSPSKAVTSWNWPVARWRRT